LENKENKLAWREIVIRRHPVEYGIHKKKNHQPHYYISLYIKTWKKKNAQGFGQSLYRLWLLAEEYGN
jgi:hypothetical protein